MRPYQLDPATPINVALNKSDAIVGNDPAAVLRCFLDDPQIALPVGVWDITAIAIFSEGGCSTTNHMIKTTLRVMVTK